ncbi:MAG TPA: MFS transporter [Galbitalea sp.]|jgi:MFS family permease|nr:MFS transporter [Galbitalea sp.]
MSSSSTPPKLGARPWVMLAFGLLAQTATSMLTSTPAFLIPELHADGVPLATAGLLASTTTIGMVLALVAWGALADRIGERRVISGGLALAALAALAAAAVTTSFALLAVFLVIGGAASASSSPASGRLVVGWFPRNRRGLAMGIRQMSQPLGVALAAFIVPPLAEGAGLVVALLVSVVFCGALAIACAILLRDPARPQVRSADARPANPYRGDRTLVRIHFVSVLLVVPQFAVSTFGLVWLIEIEKLPVGIAGLIVGLSQLIGAVGRIGVGVWSDRVGSRMRPLRWVAMAAVASMLLVAAVGFFVIPVLACALLIVAATITVADNGLAFAAVAELAGPAWSGRALGFQNTGQWIGASLVGPLAGLLIGAAGFPVMFAAAGLCALVAIPLVPRAGDREHGTPATPKPASASR